MGYKFSLVLSREITNEESTVLQGAGCGEAVFLTDSLPTNAEITVTKMDFDDTVSPSLAEAIEAALVAVKTVPDLTVPGLTVPAQPATAAAEEAPEGALPGEQDATVGEEPAAKEPTARKATSKKKTTEKSNTGNAENGSDPVGATATSD